jgi:hypothetical protein
MTFFQFSQNIRKKSQKSVEKVGRDVGYLPWSGIIASVRGIYGVRYCLTLLSHA